MADISTLKKDKADKLGCDYVSTTLWGYTLIQLMKVLV